MAAPRTLVLLRHAKSDWGSPALSDFERPLAPRGERDAPRIGGWMAENVAAPDRVISSPARRAEQTTRLALEAAGLEPGAVDWDRRVYGAGIDDLLAVLSDTPAGAGTVLLVGHNPGLWELTEHLIDGTVPTEPNQKPFPTGMMVVLALTRGWDGLQRGSAEVSAAIRPRQLG